MMGASSKTGTCEPVGFFLRLTAVTAHHVAGKLGVRLSFDGEVYLDTFLQCVVVWP